MRLLLQVAPASNGKNAQASMTGPERRVARQAAFWQDRRVEVGYIYPRFGTIAEDLSASRHRIHDHAVSRSNAFHSVFLIASWILEHRYEALVSNGPIAVDFVCSIATAITRCRHIVGRPCPLGDIKVSGSRRLLLGILDKWTLNNAWRIVAVSLNGKEKLAQQETNIRRNIEVIYNGFAVKNVHEYTKEMPNSEKSSCVIGFVGHLRREKGLFDFLKVIARLILTSPSLTAEIIGSGPDEAELKRFAHELGIEANVRFAGFSRNPGNMMRNWTLLLFPSYREGLPMSIIEAMWLGVPVVASCVGGIPELIDNGRSGYLVEPGDIDTMTERCGDLLENPQKRNALSKRAEEIAIEHFSEKDTNENLLELLRSGNSTASVI